MGFTFFCRAYAPTRRETGLANSKARVFCRALVARGGDDVLRDIELVLFYSPSWRDHWQEEWGRPVGDGRHDGWL